MARDYFSEEIEGGIQKDYFSEEISGKIAKLPSLPERLKGRARRVGAIASRITIGDVPFARKLLPTSAQQVQPYGDEKSLENILRFGRDVGAFALAERGFGALPLAQRLRGAGLLGAKGGKLARFAGRQLPFAASGATVSGATARSEDPREIAKQAALGSAAYPVLRKTGEVISRKFPRAAAQAFQDVGSFTSSVPGRAIEVAQREGIGKLFSKKAGYRAERSVQKLGERVSSVFNKLRKRLGENVGKVTERYAETPMSIRGTAKNFSKLVAQEGQADLLVAPKTLQEATELTSQPARATVSKAYNDLVRLSGQEKVTIKLVKNFIDRIDDDIVRVGRATREGRYLSILRDRLSKGVVRNIPRSRDRFAYARANQAFSNLMQHGERLDKAGILTSGKGGVGFEVFTGPGNLEAVVQKGPKTFAKREAIHEFSNFAKKYGIPDIFSEAEKTMAAQALSGGQFQGIRTGIFQNLIGSGAGALGLGALTGLTTGNPYLALASAGLGGAMSTPRGLATIMGGGQNIGRRLISRPISAFGGKTLPNVATRRILPVLAQRLLIRRNE